MRKKNMINHLKTVVALVLALCIAVPLSGGAYAAYAAEGTCGESLAWSFDKSSGTLTITGTGEMKDYYITDENDESIVAWSPFSTKIKSLVLPDGITSIGSSAFAGLQYLQSAVIPDSVVKIGEKAFYECVRMTELTIGTGVQEIGDFAFAYLKSLKKLNFNAVSTRMPLKTGELQNGKMYAFSNGFYAAGVAGKGLDVVFGDSVQTIPPFIFGRQEIQTSGKSKGVYDDLLKKFPITTFFNWLPVYKGRNPYPLNKVTSVKFGSSVAYIDECAFANCNTLKSIDFSDSIEYIGSFAFACGTKVKLSFPNDTCYAAKTVQSCKDKPDVKYVSGGSDTISFEYIHIVDPQASVVEQVLVYYPVEIALNFGASILIGLGYAVGGIFVGIFGIFSEIISVICLPIFPLIWAIENIAAVADYWIGYYKHTHV